MRVCAGEEEDKRAASGSVPVPILKTAVFYAKISVMINVACVEDEQGERERLKEYLARYEQEYDVSFSVAYYGDGDEFVSHFAAQFDLILMDIELPLLYGMKAAEEVREKDRYVAIIFVTASPQYAIRGYKVGALDYVLKPVSYYAFSQAVERALRLRSDSLKRYITVRVKGGAVKLDISQLLYVDVLDHYVCYHTKNGEYTTKTSIREVAEKLAGEDFFQCSKAFLVNLAMVDGIDGNDLLIGDTRIPVSRSRKKAFLEAMNMFMMRG